VIEKGTDETALWRLYEPTDRVAVAQYLRTYPFLTDLLIELADKAREYFGSDIRLGLEVVIDPEADDHDDLFAFIHTSLPRVEARARLHAFDDGWWLDQSDRAQCRLTIDVENHAQP